MVPSPSSLDFDILDNSEFMQKPLQEITRVCVLRNGRSRTVAKKVIENDSEDLSVPDNMT